VTTSPTEHDALGGPPRRLDAGDLIQRYRAVRACTLRLAEPLSAEDCAIQSMPDVSPTRWHLAHTTWFFETFVLARAPRGHRAFDPAFAYLFNSYYDAVGPQYPRARRGLLSRPSTAEVLAYRSAVDAQLPALLEQLDPRRERDQELLRAVELGLHHEQQHQELILTDIKHVLSVNPLRPAYRPRGEPGSSDGPTARGEEAAAGRAPAADGAPAGAAATDGAWAARPDGACPGAAPVQPPLSWHGVDAGLHRIGDAGAAFAFDNERPRHRVFLEPFELASRLVTNGEYAQFIEDGGYQRPELWLADGWAKAQAEGWRAPLYWTDGEPRGAGQAAPASRRQAADPAARRRDAARAGLPPPRYEFTLAGLLPLDPSAPVCHVSYYEADAYARWAGARLPTEQEWEVLAPRSAAPGAFVEDGCLHPRPAAAAAARELTQMLGDAWEWTSSAYSPYPGYRPPAGALGEYNGKFMCNQQVLRGGSCATSRGHIRITYRNFFYPDARWQLAGIRLARS
jgi:formylglycine-generating enzyme required for sulfatase activity